VLTLSLSPAELAHHGRENVLGLLDEPSDGQRPLWTLVDAAWTPKASRAANSDNGSSG
jgi:hypothetical protein